jgi:hypothetical protein
MENLILLGLGVLLVYFLISRKGGMGGMGCCGGHGAHGGESDHDSHRTGAGRQYANGRQSAKPDHETRAGGMGCCGGHDNHDAEPEHEKHPKELSPHRKEHIIELGEDQYAVLPGEEPMQPKKTGREVSEKVN